MIAHRLSTIRNADRIFVFDSGNIVESGKHEELMGQEDSVYRRLVLAQEVPGWTESKPKEHHHRNGMFEIV